MCTVSMYFHVTLLPYVINKLNMHECVCTVLITAAIYIREHAPLIKQSSHSHLLTHNCFFFKLGAVQL